LKLHVGATQLNRKELGCSFQPSSGTDSAVTTQLQWYHNWTVSICRTLCSQVVPGQNLFLYYYYAF